MGRINDDMDEYERLCEVYNEKVRYSTGGPDCYGKHATELKDRNRAAHELRRQKMKITKDKIILTDADGVLVNWNEGFDNFMSDCGFPRIPGTDSEYSISARHGISGLQGIKFIKEFNESERIKYLDSFADSQTYVTLLAELGFRFIVVTSISDNPLAFYNRSINLKSLFGDVFEEINCITMGASKGEILKRWQDTGYYWIEDHMRQAEAGFEAGLKPLLISHPYNDHYSTDLFPKISYDTPWKDVYEIVCKDYNITT